MHLTMTVLVPIATAFVVSPSNRLQSASHVRHGRKIASATSMIYDEYDQATGIRASHSLVAHHAGRSLSAATLGKFRWNLNVGRGPWGFAMNAEVWNGRVRGRSLSTSIHTLTRSVV